MADIKLTAMSKDELNKRLHKALGLDHWAPAPNYAVNPQLLLHIIIKREDYLDFALFAEGISPENCSVLTEDYIYWSASILLGESGLLAQLALDWLER